jgi:ribosomal protein S18 acetylase RimI-like enzyme
MIRPFKETDKDTLVEIFKLNTPQYFDTKEVNDFIEYLENHSNTYWTIEHEDKIVGGSGFYVKESDNSGRITWIFLHPNYSGLGLGKKAVEYSLTTLRQNPKVEKFVVMTSQLAFKFFEKLGYKLIKTEKDYWGVGLDLYEMEMPNGQRASQ